MSLAYAIFRVSAEHIRTTTYDFWIKLPIGLLDINTPYLRRLVFALPISGFHQTLCEVGHSPHLAQSSKISDRDLQVGPMFSGSLTHAHHQGSRLDHSEKTCPQMPWRNIFVLAVAEKKPLTFAKAWIRDVARNFRLPNRGGEIDLIGWDRDVLCFIEVKTRTTRDVKPAEAGRWIAKSVANC